MDAEASWVRSPVHRRAAVLGEMADGAVFRVKFRHNPFYLLDSSDIDELLNEFAAQALVLKFVSNDNANFRFLR